MKLRVCASILNSKKYKDTIEFVAVDFNVENHCTKGLVSLRIKSKDDSNVSSERTFEDWMLPCRARMIETNSPITFYMSDGFEDETSAFVYTSTYSTEINRELVEYFKKVHALTDAPVSGML